IGQCQKSNASDSQRRQGHGCALRPSWNWPRQGNRAGASDIKQRWPRYPAGLRGKILRRRQGSKCASSWWIGCNRWIENNVHAPMVGELVLERAGIAFGLRDLLWGNSQAFFS